MSSNVLLTLFILCYVSATLAYIHEFQVSKDVPNREPSNSGIQRSQDTQREKREVEKFEDEEYPSAPSQDEQEEPGFWDRIVRVALKLFNRFIEWLNSS